MQKSNADDDREEAWKVCQKTFDDARKIYEQDIELAKATSLAAEANCTEEVMNTLRNAIQKKYNGNLSEAWTIYLRKIGASER